MLECRSLSHTVRVGLLILFTSAALWAALVSFASAESITSFDSNIQVGKDGKLRIIEEITYDFGSDQRHGIYRNIRNDHAQPSSTWYKERFVDINLQSVFRNGSPEPYQLQDYDGLSVRIGDANQTITGEHVYKVVYTVEGALSVYEGLTELYWDVTGDEWTVPMNQVSVTLWGEDGVTLSAQQSCYVGASGSGDRCDSMLVNNVRANFFQAPLKPGQGMTIAQALTVPISPVVMEKNGPHLWIFVLVVWLGILIFWIYNWRTHYRIEQSVVAQYEPYQGFRPMFTGVLLDNRLDASDITAGIIYLAQQGFISIKQTTDKVLFLFETTDYEVTLLRDMYEAEKSSHRTLLQLFFPANEVSTTVKLSDIKNSQSKLKTNAKAIKKLKKALVVDLVDLGFLEQRMKRSVKTVLLVVFLILGFQIFPIFASFVTPQIFIAAILIIISIALVMLFGLERRTVKGYEALNYLKGFKEFLSVTERERYKFHNAPAKNPEQFMEYLPYAIAFGVEKEWAEVFKDVFIDTPEWYSSNVAGSQFMATHLISDLGSFATAFATTTGPSGSGSSGGGVSGGGGGGGGGGSW